MNAASSAPRIHIGRIRGKPTWVRHPVSVTRHRLSLSLLFLMTIGFAVYHYNTRDEAIRRRAVAFLADTTAGEVHVGQAHFRMFGGIRLDDVQVSVPFDEQLDRAAVDPTARQIFSARAVTLVHSPWRLLFGSLRVEHVIAAQPQITLVHNVDSDVRNWHLLAGTHRMPLRKGSPPRPRMTIRSAKAVAVSVHSDGRHEARTEELDADIRPQPQSDTGYCIEVRRYSEPAERTTVVFDPAAKLVSNTPYVDAATVRLQLPKVAQQFFDEIHLQGEVKLGRLMYGDHTTDAPDTEVELRHVRCDVPLALFRSGGASLADSASSPPEDNGIALLDASGRMALTGGRLEVDVSGLFNGAKCTVKGTLFGIERSLSEMGIDVHLQGSNVPTPEGHARERIITDPAVPLAMKSFFEDYQPHGKFDLDVHLVRPVGPEGRVQMHGILRPLAARGKCRWFPYEVTDLEGRVRVEGDQIRVEHLIGQHAGAEIQVDAQIDRHEPWSDVTVDIAASHVPLDHDLFDALSDHEKTLWRRFNPEGAAALSVHLQRQESDNGDAAPVWRSHINADLEDARLVFSEYPYPLDHVVGRIIRHDQQMQFVGLTGHHESATVRVDGDVELSADQPASVELRVDAKHVPLDNVLANALQAEGRGAFQQFQPQGFIDLAGGIALHDMRQGVTYDLIARVSDAAVCYQPFPYRITDVNGEVIVRPDGFSIINVAGRHGDAGISVRGDIRRNADGYIADLEFDCQRLALTEDLYTALPPSLKDVWNLLKPQGTVQIQTALHTIAQGDSIEQRHRTHVSFSNAALCFAGFPLPLSSVTGEASVSSRGVEIHSLQGRCGEGQVSLSGRIDLAGSATRASLAFDATGLAFSKSLLAAMPAGLRSALESCNVTGGFDLHINPLSFDLTDDGQSRWNFAGAMNIHNAGADLGIEVRNASGSLTGHGTVFSSGSVQLDARACLDKVQLAGWQLDHFIGRVVKEIAGNRIDLRDASAEAYGGQTTGAAEIKLAGRGADYQVSIVTRDMQLGRYLSSLASNPTSSQPARVHTARKGSSEPTSARGSIDGNLVVRGRVGTGAFREGSGEVFVRHAEVWRLPLVFLIFQVLNLAPDENVFHDGWLKFYLSGDTLTFHQIDLQGRALSFVGNGTMNTADRQLDILLLARSPVRVRLPVLTDALELFAREIMEVKVSGTLDKPVIRPQPLRTLSVLGKALFAPPPAKSSPPPTPKR